MKQVAMSHNFNRSMDELSRRISSTLTSNPSWSVQTMSTVMYDSPSGGKFVDAVVIYNIDKDRAVLDTPKLAGDVWDNGYRLPVDSDPIPCAKGAE